MIRTKPFCQFLYDMHDRPAKDAVYRFLLKWYASEIHPDQQPNEYGRYDFIMYKGDDEVKVEVQRKLGWTDKPVKDDQFICPNLALRYPLC